MKYRIILSIAFAMFVAFLFWAGGFDFNSRGSDAVTATMLISIGSLGGLLLGDVIDKGNRP